MSDWPHRRDAMIRSLAPKAGSLRPWERPALAGRSRHGDYRLYFAMQDFERHVTSETAELQRGLATAGYDLCGKGYEFDWRDAGRAVDADHPYTAILTDQREWDPRWPGCFDASYGFTGIKELGRMDTVFRGTILKDAWSCHQLRYENHRDLNPHFYIYYYDADLMLAMCPWIRREQLILTCHTVDSPNLPKLDFSNRQGRALLSGALNPEYYPLRCKLAQDATRMLLMDVRPHPGYGNRGCDTPAYLEALGRYRVAICTSSSLGLPLRKLIEATAMGCRVITDLPESEYMPYIDENFTRVSVDSSPYAIGELVAHLAATYDEEAQIALAARARHAYDYRRIAARLAERIETARINYQGE
jgi:hypothetical protein